MLKKGNDPNPSVEIYGSLFNRVDFHNSSNLVTI